MIFCLFEENDEKVCEEECPECRRERFIPKKTETSRNTNVSHLQGLIFKNPHDVEISKENSPSLASMVEDRAVDL